MPLLRRVRLPRPQRRRLTLHCRFPEPWPGTQGLTRNRTPNLLGHLQIAFPLRLLVSRLDRLNKMRKVRVPLPKSCLSILKYCWRIWVYKLGIIFGLFYLLLPHRQPRSPRLHPRLGSCRHCRCYFRVRWQPQNWRCRSRCLCRHWIRVCASLVFSGQLKESKL